MSLALLPNSPKYGRGASAQQHGAESGQNLEFLSRAEIALAAKAFIRGLAEAIRPSRPQALPLLQFPNPTACFRGPTSTCLRVSHP